MSEPLATLFGRIIRQRREALDLSQEELGARTSVSRNYIGMVERGETNPTLLVLQGLAKALGTTMVSLIGDLEAQADTSGKNRNTRTASPPRRPQRSNPTPPPRRG